MIFLRYCKKVKYHNMQVYAIERSNSDLVDLFNLLIDAMQIVLVEQGLDWIDKWSF